MHATSNCRNSYRKLFPEFWGFAAKDKLSPSSSQKYIKHKRFPGMHIKCRPPLLIPSGIYIKRSIQNLFFIIKIGKSPLNNFPVLPPEMIV